MEVPQEAPCPYYQVCFSGHYMRLVLTSIVGLIVPNRAVMVWHRGKAKINRLLGNAPPGVPTVYESTCRLPHEIVEMVIAHLPGDRDALRACSLTCHSWYATVVPYIHHTLLLGDKQPGTPFGGLRPLSKMHKNGLTHLVKEIRVRQWNGRPGWFLPRAFSSSDLRYFSAFSSVQTLKIQQFDINRFIPGIKRYFEQFSPTLRSISLSAPTCRPLQQLPYFLSLFPNLDDIDISNPQQPYGPMDPIPSEELVPFSAPKLRGELTLYAFYLDETWTYLISACGGLRFRYMELCMDIGCAPILLGACAETLETLRFSVTNDLSQ